MKKQKKTHNKKRNAMFLYEVLVKELTKAIVEKDKEKKEKIISLLKESFKKGSLLYKELEYYKTLLEAKGLDLKLAEKILLSIKEAYEKLDKVKLYNEQSELINKINRLVSSEVFTNFVPNYRSMATVYQVFNNTKVPIKSRVLLEQNVINLMVEKIEDKKEELQPIDKLVFKKFVEKFNTKYIQLLKEQQELLENYVLSSLNNVEFKVYLNEELGRLKDVVRQSLLMEEIKNDSYMMDKTNQTLNLLESFKEKEIDQDMIEKMLKIQQLVEEIQK